MWPIYTLNGKTLPYRYIKKSREFSHSHQKPWNVSGTLVTPPRPWILALFRIIFDVNRLKFCFFFFLSRPIVIVSGSELNFVLHMSHWQGWCIFRWAMLCCCCILGLVFSVYLRLESLRYWSRNLSSWKSETLRSVQHVIFVDSSSNRHKTLTHDTTTKSLCWSNGR
jgi:hypothetical protein